MMFMKNIYLLLIISLLTFFSNSPLFCQSTYTWIGANGGSWTTSTNWSPTRTTPQVSDLLIFSSGNTLSVTAVLTQTIGRLTISNNSRITFNGAGGILTIGNQTGDDIVIASGSSLTLGTSGNITLVGNATADIAGGLNINTGRAITAGGAGAIVNISGTLTNNGTYNASTTNAVTNITGTFVNSTGGTISNSTVARLNFASNGTYQHSQNGGVIPTATWNRNSTCLINGITTTNPTNMGQTFGNLTWNCPSQTSDANFDGIFTLTGNFNLNSTGLTGVFRFASGTTSITGNYSQSGGISRLANTSNRTLNVSGNFSMTGGELRMSVGSGIGIMNISGNVSHTSGTITETSSGSGSINFNGAMNQSYSGGGTISGTINFTTNNSAGITLLTSVTFPAGLTMTNGNIALNGFTLTLGTGATTATRGTLAWTSGLITGNGTFTRWFSTASITLGNVLGLFPMGNSTDNRNVWIGGTPLIGGTISVQHNNLTGTTALSFIENSLSFDKRTNMSWTLSTANGFAGLSLALRIQGSGIPGINAVGDLNICLASGIAGGTYSAPGGSVTNPQVNRSGLTQTNLANTFYFASTSGSPLPVELSYFAVKTLKGGGAQLDWKTETEISNYGFEVYRLNQSSDWKLIGFVEGYGNSNSPKEYLFEDKNVSSGKYSYRLKQIDTAGNFTYSKTIEINFGLPAEFELSQNYPNPFNPVTTIKFSLPESGNVKLTIYNLLGEQVEEPINEFKNAGVHTINFNASELNSGVYIYKIESNGFVQSRKMTLIK
jgi:hypothetical protein